MNIFLLFCLAFKHSQPLYAILYYNKPNPPAQITAPSIQLHQELLSCAFACPVNGSTLKFPILVVFVDAGMVSILPFQLSPGTMRGARVVIAGGGAGLVLEDICGG